MDFHRKKGMDTTSLYLVAALVTDIDMDNIDTNMPYPKISKCTSGYVEEESFNNADLGTGYFCNNCTYFINDKQCAIVKDSGPDVNGKESGIIAPYGSCDLWYPNKEVESGGATKKSI